MPTLNGHRCTSSPCVNAPAESVATNAPLCTVFERHRCAIPADAFYQWKRLGPDKVSWRFRRTDGRIFLIAGLWETWARDAGSDPISTFTILTTPSNSLIAPVHHRMPAILVGDAAPVWLDPNSSRSDLLAALRPAPPGFLVDSQDPTPAEIPTRINQECWAAAN
jgi:putative SOS response-associated peptidase YedK